MRDSFLPRAKVFSYVAFMNLAARFLLGAMVISLFTARSAAQSTQELIEEVKRLAGQVADLRDANDAQNRRMAQMQKELDSVRGAVRDSSEKSAAKLGDFATRDDLKKLSDGIREVDQKREADRKLILNEFEKLGRTLAQTEKPEKSSRASRRAREKESEPEPAGFEGKVLPVTVKPGQLLSNIRDEYNAALKEQRLPAISMEDIKRANPGLNPDKIYAGQTINLPVPDKK